MSENNGIHHLAIATADIKAQIEFFNDVLGCELVALYWMHGVEGAWHGFMKLNDNCYHRLRRNARHQRASTANSASPTPAAAADHVPVEPCSTSPSTSTPSTISWRCETESARRGITIFGPLDHGMCHSIYFAGPEDLTLEVATSAQPIDGRAWIDPEVVELAGITAEELDRYRNPVHYDDRRRERRPTPVRLVAPMAARHPRGDVHRAHRHARRGRDRPDEPRTRLR